MAKKIKGKGKKKRIILIFLVIILACIGGVGAYFVKESSAGPAEIEQSEAKFFTTLKESPTDGSTPLDYSAYDNIAFALWKIENTDQFRTVTQGKSDASVATITISGERYVKNGVALTTSVSEGMVSSGIERYFVDGKVLLRKADKIDGFNTTWKDDVP